MKPKWKRKAQKQRAKNKQELYLQRIGAAIDLANKVDLKLCYRSVSKNIYLYFWLENRASSFYKIIQGDLKTIEQYLDRLWQLKSFL